MTDTYTLLYDGTCRICTAQMQWVARYDTQQRIVLADINDPAQRARFPSITPAAAQREIHLVAPDGTIYRARKPCARHCSCCLPCTAWAH